jgi:hypothetical protein
LKRVVGWVSHIIVGLVCIPFHLQKASSKRAKPAHSPKKRRYSSILPRAIRRIVAPGRLRPSPSAPSIPVRQAIFAPAARRALIPARAKPYPKPGGDSGESADRNLPRDSLAIQTGKRELSLAIYLTKMHKKIFSDANYYTCFGHGGRQLVIVGSRRCLTNFYPYSLSNSNINLNAGHDPFSGMTPI